MRALSPSCGILRPANEETQDTLSVDRRSYMSVLNGPCSWSISLSPESGRTRKPPISTPKPSVVGLASQARQLAGCCERAETPRTPSSRPWRRSFPRRSQCPSLRSTRPIPDDALPSSRRRPGCDDDPGTRALRRCAARLSRPTCRAVISNRPCQFRCAPVRDRRGAIAQNRPVSWRVPRCWLPRRRARS